MGFSIGWDNEEKTVVLQQYIDNVTKDDWYNMAQQSAEMLATAPHTVHIIIDERSADLTATSTDMRFLEKLVPPNEGVCVIVVPREKFLYKEMTKRLREKFIPDKQHDAYFVETIEDARQLLQEQFEVVYR